MTIQLGRAGGQVIANSVATMFNYVISKHTSGLHCKQGMFSKHTGSLHCKQGTMLLINIQVLNTVNKVCY